MKEWELNKMNIFFDKDDPPGGKPKDPPKDSPKDPPADPPAGDPKDPPKTIPYERFKEVNDRTKKLETELADIKKKQADAKDKDLKDQEKWKELYETKEKELAAKTVETLRLKVASKKGIPADLVDRLVGSTEEELEADADKLLEFVKVDDSKGVPGRKKGGAAALLDIKDMSPKEIREKKNELMEKARSGK